jgi:hypothetical protein
VNDELRNAWLLGLLALVLAVILSPHEGGWIWLVAVYLLLANVVLFAVLRRRS